MYDYVNSLSRRVSAPFSLSRSRTLPFSALLRAKGGEIENTAGE